MTLSECIAKVMQLRPSEFDKDDLTGWVNEVEFRAYDEVIKKADLRPIRPLRPPVTVVPDPVVPENELPDEEDEETTEGTTEAEETADESETAEEEKPVPPAYRRFIYRPYKYSTDAERHLLIPDQFKYVYFTYLFARQDFFLGEIDRFNMEAIQYENEFLNFAKWFRRTHKPKEVRHDTYLRHKTCKEDPLSKE